MNPYERPPRDPDIPDMRGVMRELQDAYRGMLNREHVVRPNEDRKAPHLTHCVNPKGLWIAVFTGSEVECLNLCDLINTEYAKWLMVRGTAAEPEKMRGWPL